MRLFLNSGTYPNYRRNFDARSGTSTGFRQRCDAYLDDRYGAAHLLKPVLDRDSDAFFTCGDDEVLQRAWAHEQGMSTTDDLTDILLAQIEAHRTEVFYNLDPMRYDSTFVRRLPGCVRYTLCWRAAPSPGADFSAYDRVVCNFPSIIAAWRSRGWRSEYFIPAHDPVMDGFSVQIERPVDVTFVGGYSRHHRRRAEVLKAVAGISDRHDIHYHLDSSRLTRLAEHPLAVLLPLERYRRPRAIRRVSAGPVYGRDFYAHIGHSKIVLNGAIDMAGEERGNMRCFEAMGCGALLVSDVGNYPEGMNPGENMLVYSSSREAVELIEDVLGNWPAYAAMARKGYEMVSTQYSKQRQWQRFQELLEGI